MSRRLRQAIVATLIVVTGLALFLAIERAITPRYCLETRFDRAVPFLPFTLALYDCLFPFVVLAALLADRTAFAHFQAATILSCVVAFVCFLAFPEAIPRPPIALVDNPVLRARFQRMWGLDAATNGCPSLHVALAWIAAATLMRRRRGLAANTVVVLAAAAICAATLTVKQHTIWDVVGGTGLAAAALAFVAWRTKAAADGRVAAGVPASKATANLQ